VHAQENNILEETNRVSFRPLLLKSEPQVALTVRYRQNPQTVQLYHVTLLGAGTFEPYCRLSPLLGRAILLWNENLVSGDGELLNPSFE
jgi:hypothetical protein